MKEIQKFSIKEVAEKFSGPWDPKDVAGISDRVVRVAKFEGSYGDKLHTHTYPEFFLILKGEITIELEGGKIILEELEGAVIPAGVGHRPVADKPALVLMIDKQKE